MAAPGCFCPDDCGCRKPWRPTYCGCRAHDGTAITVTRSRIYPSRPRAGGAWHYLYEAQGPDTIEMPGGRVLPRRFDNRSIVELRRVLKRAYGSDVQIVEEWKAGEVSSE